MNTTTTMKSTQSIEATIIMNTLAQALLNETDHNVEFIPYGSVHGTDVFPGSVYYIKCNGNEEWDEIVIRVQKIDGEEHLIVSTSVKYTLLYFSSSDTVLFDYSITSEKEVKCFLDGFMVHDYTAYINSKIPTLCNMLHDTIQECCGSEITMPVIITESMLSCEHRVGWSVGASKIMDTFTLHLTNTGRHYDATTEFYDARNDRHLFQIDCPAGSVPKQMYKIFCLSDDTCRFIIHVSNRNGEEVLRVHMGTKDYDQNIYFSELMFAYSITNHKVLHKFMDEVYGESDDGPNAYRKTIDKMFSLIRDVLESSVGYEITADDIVMF